MTNESKLIIGISSRALFNLDESHEIYETEGLDSYRDYQIANEDKTLDPGEAFNLVKKILDIKPQSFSPRPKIDSSLLLFTPKENFFKLKDPKNLEKITRIFFSQRRKMLKKPFNQVFDNGKEVAEKFGIDLNLRPQNLEPEVYFKLVKEYEDLRG